MSKTSASHWMQTSNYGRALASRASRYSARHYRIIIATLLCALLILETFHAPLLLGIVTVIGILLYLIYLLVRLYLPERWQHRYYVSRFQFIRAQVGIAGLTVLLFSYAHFAQSNDLWILYILGLMIISEHCSTSALLLTMGWIGLLLIGIGYVSHGASLLDYLSLSPHFMSALLRALAIFLLGFLLHYLVRNVGARDTTIHRYRKVLDNLALNIRSLKDPVMSRKVVLDTIQALHGAHCAMLWTFDSKGERLILAACTKRDEAQVNGCPAVCSTPGKFSIPIDDERLPACVARTQQNHFASRADKPPSQLDDALAASQPFLAHARLELGIPIADFKPRKPASQAILCLAFDRLMSHDEMRQAYDALCEIAQHLTPILYYASLLEQHQALQRAVQTVTHSLDRQRVLKTLLELMTDGFGFDFATVSLVDPDREVIQSVCGVNADWVSVAVHTLDSDDIQADVIRTGQTEILTGWDERFDKNIWERFGHKNMVRIFMPLAVMDPVTGERENIGTLEAGYHHRPGEECQEHVIREQAHLLQPFVDQAAVAVVNARLYEQMSAKAEALTALHHGGQAIQSAVGNLSALLEQIGRSAEHVLGADIVMLFGYNEKDQKAELLFIGGDVRGKGSPDPRLGEGNILDAIIQQRRSFYFSDAQEEELLVGYGGADGHRHRTFTQRQGVLSFAGVPLRHGDALLGIMCVNYRTWRCFNSKDKQLIELFGQQAAVAIQIARQHDRERKQVMLRERSALSRELHNSTSSDLFAITLKARTALHYLNASEDKIVREIQHILDIAEASKQQLGYILSEFSTDDLDGRDFRDVTQEIVAQVRRHFDIEVQINSDGCGDNGGPVILSTQKHFALSRIVKEAFNNIVRHANCQHVSVTYRLQSPDVFLEIIDDGVGFDLTRAQRRKGKFGLQNMQLYAQELGCPLQLTSTPGKGTRVAVSFSLSRPSDEGGK